MVHLYTGRLIIRDHVWDDLTDLYTLFSHQTAMAYLPDLAVGSREEAKANLRTAIEQVETSPRRKYYFAMLERDAERYIGEIGYTVTARAEIGKVVNLGYFTLPEWWGRGYVTEAVREVMRFAYEEDGVYRIETGCLRENIGSERVMVKCGMIKEAEFKEKVPHEGTLKDRVEYRLLKPEWEALYK
jgi:ribosomal-protein-alanine N-acetyltransferase